MKVETDAVEGEMLVTLLYIWTYGSLDLSLPPEVTSSRTLLTWKSKLKTYMYRFSLFFPDAYSRAAKHQNRSVCEASMKLCTGVDPPKGSWKKIPPTYWRPLVAAILKFTMAAILDLFSAITPKLRQVETFCLLLTPHFKGQGIP